MDNKTLLEQGPDGQQKVETLTKRANAVSNSLRDGKFWELYNEKDVVHFINAKAKKGSKDLNYYAFTKRDYGELNDLLNEIAVQETRLMENSESLEGLKAFNRNVWFDISRKSNAIEGIFEDFDFALVDFRKQIRGKFIDSDPVDVDNFDYLEYFQVLREREKQIESNNDSVILSVKGKKAMHTLSLETVRHYIAFKYAQRCAKWHQRHDISSSDFMAITDNVVSLLSGNDIVANRTGTARINNDDGLANWTPVLEDKIYDKLKVLTEWVVAGKNDKASTKLHPLEQAAIFHAEFIRIHPYFDGNGRTCRIMSNFILMANDMPTVALRNNRTQEYFKAIAKAIETHDVDVLLDIFYKEAIKSARNTKESLDFIEQSINSDNSLGV